MTHANSPDAQPPFSAAPDPSSQTQATYRNQVNALFLRFYRRVKGFIDSQKLPHVANKACEVYLGEADTQRQAQCRTLLQKRLQLSPHQLYHFFQTSMGAHLLAWFGQFFQFPRERETQRDLEDLLLQMASDPEGLSILSFLRRFPDRIQCDLDQVLLTAKKVDLMLSKTDATIRMIRDRSQIEMGLMPPEQFLQAPDWRQPGNFAVRSYSLTLDSPVAETHGTPPALEVLCYQPQPWPPGGSPVIVQSHGLASSPEDLAVYANHLASYGYFVVAPRHCGSDTNQVREMLAGHALEVFQLNEFIDRPQEIRALLDALDRQNDRLFAGHLRPDTVGMMGYSFGAYTAFALAGAEIHFEKLETACDITTAEANISLLLQCQALGLPRQSYDLHDDRIKAVLAIDSVGSEVFGAQGIGKISVPVMLMAGSQDIASPLVLEQIRIFQWLNTTNHYFALMQGKSHMRDTQRLTENLQLNLAVLPKDPKVTPPTPFDTYIQALSLVFFNAHLAPQGGSPSGQSMVPSADYAAYLSQSPFDLWLISQRSHASLTQTLQAIDRGLLTEIAALMST